MTDRTAYEELVDARIKEWEADIKRMEAEAQRARAEERLQRGKLAEDAHEKLEALKAKAAELKEANENAWIDLKTGVEMAMNDITSALGAVKREYR